MTQEEGMDALCQSLSAKHSVGRFEIEESRASLEKKKERIMHFCEPIIYI